MKTHLRKTHLRLAAPALIFIGAAALAAPAPAASFVATQQPGEQSTSSLTGLKVENSAGEALGVTTYFVTDTSGKITTVVIGIGGFLGLAEKSVGVPFADIKVTKDKEGKDIVRIDATKDSLTAAPNYAWTEKSTAERLKESAEDLAKQAKEGAASLAEKAKKSVDEMQAPEKK